MLTQQIIIIIEIHKVIVMQVEADKKEKEGKRNTFNNLAFYMIVTLQKTTQNEITSRSGLKNHI